MTQKSITHIIFFILLLGLVACGSSPTPTQKLEALVIIDIPEAIVQEVTIQDRYVPVVNAVIQMDDNDGANQPASNTGASPGQAQPGQNLLGGPPQDAIDACADLAVDEACTINTPHGTLEGTCLEIQATLACVPSQGGPPGAGTPPGGSSP